MGLLVAPAIAQAGAPAVQLWPQAVVQADRVRLADVASVAGLPEDQAQAALRVELGEAPAPGQARDLDVEQIRRALGEAQVNLARLSLSGAASCRVYRPAQDLSASGTAADAGEAQGGPQTLGDAVRRFLEQRLGSMGGSLEVRFAAANQQAIDLAGDGMTFEVGLRGGSPLGLVSLDVDVLEAGRPTRTVPVVAEAALLKGVVVARRPINRGAAIRAEDVSIEPRRFIRHEAIGLADVEAAVGREARRYMDRGEMLAARDVQPLPLVKRGEYVTVCFRRGGILIRGSAKALGQGTQGDRIEVKAEPGGQVYAVIVTGPKAVEVDRDAGVLLSRADEKEAP